MDDSLYIASEWGNRYHSLRVDEALGAGSAGPGKSTVLLMDPMPQIAVEHQRCAGQIPQFPLKWGHSKGWALHLRREFKMLKQQIQNAHRIFKIVDPGVQWRAADDLFEFSSGFKFEFGHCQNSGDWIKYHSSEYTHIAFDELNQFEEEQYEQISSRRRTSDPLLRTMLKIRSMSNPVQKREGNFNLQINNPFWVRKRFVDDCRDGNKVIKRKLVRRDGSIGWWTKIYLPATLYDNPDKEFVRQYELDLLAKPAHIRHALLYGNWYTTPGSYFGDSWIDALHVCKPFRVPDHWPRFRSLDWGYKQPGVCAWWTMDDEGTLYMEREFTFQGQEVPQVAKRIREIETDAKLWHRDSSLITGPADTQLWEKRGDAVRTKAAEFQAHGVNWRQADKSSRARAAQLLLGRFNDHQNMTKPPGVVFFEHCTMTRNTLPGIMAVDGDPETPQDGGEDHWLDCCLYATSYASHGKAGLGGQVKRYDDDDPEPEQDTGRTYNRGRYGIGQRAN